MNRAELLRRSLAFLLLPTAAKLGLGRGATSVTTPVAIPNGTTALFASAGEWKGPLQGGYLYSWRRQNSRGIWEEIATGPSLVLGEAEVGCLLSCKVSPE